MGRKLFVAALAALSLVSTGAVVAGAHSEDRLIAFDSMTPVTGQAVGAVNDRGLKGGGLPWAITSGSGSVDRQGDVSVSVSGLIIPLLGRNPIASLRATVSCITPHGVANVSTAAFPASTAGDSTIAARVDLPHPCKDPIVFVVAPSGQWFAESNAEGDD